MSEQDWGAWAAGDRSSATVSLPRWAQYGGLTVEVAGPVLEDEALAAFKGFF